MKRHHIAVAPNLHWRFTGVTATIIATVPRQARSVGIVATGPMMPTRVPHLGFSRVLLSGWSRPAGFQTRVWHARRNNEMIVGVILRHILRQPWTLVFTSSAQRRHTAFTRWLIRRMDGVIATSSAAAAYLEAPAHIIPHGVDHERFHPDASGPRVEPRSDSKQMVIGAFGRIRAQKGTDLFVTAMLRLLPKYPEAKAVICGSVTRSNRAYFEALKQQVAGAGLTDRFVFLGELPPDDVPGWFARLDVFVAPMRSEGFGLTPLEAMASGVAVVSTRTGAAEQTLDDGRTGLLVPPDDIEQLTNAIDDLLGAPEKREQFGKAGRERTLRNFDIGLEAARLNAFYLQLLAEKQAGRLDQRRQPA